MMGSNPKDHTPLKLTLKSVLLLFPFLESKLQELALFNVVCEN